MKSDAVTLQRVAAGADNLRNALVEGIAERNVGDGTSLEEGERADALGAVDDLVGDHEVAGLDLLLQTADGGEGNDGADANGAEGGDVRAGGHLMGRDLVVLAMTAQEGDGDGLVVVRALVVQDRDGRGGLAPGSGDVQRSNLGETREFAEAGSADDGDADGVYKRQFQSAWLAIATECQRSATVGKRGSILPLYVEGRAVILRASCFADSIFLRGFVGSGERKRRSEQAGSIQWAREWEECRREEEKRRRATEGFKSQKLRGGVGSIGQSRGPYRHVRRLRQPGSQAPKTVGDRRFRFRRLSLILRSSIYPGHSQY